MARESKVPDEPGQAAERHWTVGQLAAEFGITTRTLRHYEAEGLLTPERHGAQRRYGAGDRARLTLVLRGRRFGMTLAECREIVGLYDGATSSEVHQLQVLLERLADIASDLRARQRDLSRTLEEVYDVTDRCRQRLAELTDRDLSP